MQAEEVDKETIARKMAKDMIESGKMLMKVFIESEKSHKRFKWFLSQESIRKKL